MCEKMKINGVEKLVPTLNDKEKYSKFDLPLNRIPDLKLGFITVLRYHSLLVTSLISLCFLMFSAVLPNTELFMSLKKSFSKSFFA